MRRFVPALLAVLICGLAPVSGSPERIVDTFRATRYEDAPFRPLPFWEAPGQPSLALALSGGGARGIAHVGVLYALAEDGVRIDAIAGTSMGALIGSFAAGGYTPAQIEDILRDRDWDAIIGSLDVRNRTLSRDDQIALEASQVRLRFRGKSKLQVGALIDSQLMERELYRYLLAAQLESGGDLDRLRYRFRPVSTNILTGKPVVPSHGDLVTLVRGSSSVPGIFRPVPFGDALLVDGGLVENVPVETAKSFGTDLVVAVNVSEGIVPDAHIKSAVDLLNRSVNVMMWERSAELLEMADLVVSPDVIDLSSSQFQKNVAEFVVAGYEGYRARRDEIWNLLESASGDPRIAFDRIEVVGTEWVKPETLTWRLGGAPGEVTRFRIVAELARLLNEGPFDDGSVEWVETEDGKILRFRMIESAVVRKVVLLGPLSVDDNDTARLTGGRLSLAEARMAGWEVRRGLIRDGRVLVDFRKFEWDPATGTATGEIGDARVGKLTVSVQGDVSPRPIERALEGFQGERFRFDRLADRLDEMVARGAILEWSLSPSEREDGTVDLEVRVKADRYYEVGLALEYRGAYRFAGLGRIAKSNITGRGDFLDLIVGAATDTNFAQIRYRTEYGLKFKNIGAEVGYRYFDNTFPFVDEEQETVSLLAQDYRGHRTWVDFIKRLRYGVALKFGVFHERNRLDASALEPEEELSRYSTFLSFDLDRHDRLLFPTRGSSLVLNGENSFSGFDLWKYELFTDSSFSIRPRRLHTFTLRAGAGMSEGAARRAYYFNPGGYENLYGFIPYGATAPQYAKIGATWRYQWLEISGVRLYVEVGADAIRTAFDRSQLGSAPTVYGYGATVTAQTGLIGPISIGAARNSEDATVVFFTFGYPVFER